MLVGETIDRRQRADDNNKRYNKEKSVDNKKIVEFIIPSELGYEKTAIAIITNLAQKIDLPPERIDDLKTAIGEAVTNAIEHGNQLNPQLNVSVTALIQEDSIVLQVIDQGLQSLTKPALFRQDRTDNRGWGLFLIQRLMDEVKVITAPNRNELQMVMYRPALN